MEKTRERLQHIAPRTLQLAIVYSTMSELCNLCSVCVRRKLLFTFVCHTTYEIRKTHESDSCSSKVSSCRRWMISLGVISDVTNWQWRLTTVTSSATVLPSVTCNLQHLKPKTVQYCNCGRSAAMPLHSSPGTSTVYCSAGHCGIFTRVCRWC